jgi:predicted homoserine dehydrogenase-like protein
MQSSRRDFLMVPAAAALSAQSPNDTVRVAFIGVGNRGGYLLRQMLKVPGIKIIAICDIDAETLRSSTEAAASFSCKRCSFVVPGIGTIHGF